LALRLTQTSSDGGLSESEQVDVTVRPVRCPGAVPTVTSAATPAHSRMACLKPGASIVMPRSRDGAGGYGEPMLHDRPASAVLFHAALMRSAPRCFSRGITSFRSNWSEW